MTKRDFINDLIKKLDDYNSLDSRNYSNEEDQKSDIYDLVNEYLNDFIIIQGQVIEEERV